MKVFSKYCPAIVNVLITEGLIPTLQDLIGPLEEIADNL
jgi:hypothetical protein